MSEASEKKVIEPGASVADEVSSSENVLELLRGIARGDGGYAIPGGPHSSDATSDEYPGSPRYLASGLKRPAGQALVYSCACPAVLAILQTLSDMFG